MTSFLGWCFLDWVALSSFLNNLVYQVMLSTIAINPRLWSSCWRDVEGTLFQCTRDRSCPSLLHCTCLFCWALLDIIGCCRQPGSEISYSRPVQVMFSCCILSHLIQDCIILSVKRIFFMLMYMHTTGGAAIEHKPLGLLQYIPWLECMKNLSVVYKSVWQ